MLAAVKAIPIARLVRIIVVADFAAACAPKYDTAGITPGPSA
jgi:hypothetical protein